MRPLPVLAAIAVLPLSSCWRSGPREDRRWLEADGLLWPLGRYELVSFHGQAPPVSLPEGGTITGGYCILEGNPEGPATFELRLGHRVRPNRREIRHRYFGSVAARARTTAGLRHPLTFHAGTFVDLMSTSRRFDLAPLEWREPWQAPGTLFGNELTVGEGEKTLVFMRR